MKQIQRSVTAAFIVLGCISLAHADQIITTPAGAVNPLTGETVSASADFSVSGTTLTLTLTNTLAGIHDAGQLLTGFFFTTSTGSAALTSQTGDLVKLGSGGVVTDLGVSNLGWGFGAATVNNINGFELCVICQGGVSATATPAEGILGPKSADGAYDNANASLLTGAHNPLVNNSATFKFNVAQGVTVSNVSFSFGTTPGVPEPSTLFSLGASLFALTAFVRKRGARTGNR